MRVWVFHSSILTKEIDSPVWKITKENTQNNTMDVYSEVWLEMGADI